MAGATDKRKTKGEEESIVIHQRIKIHQKLNLTIQDLGPDLNQSARKKEVKEAV